MRLSDRQYHDYSAAVGQTSFKLLTDLMASEGCRQLPTDQLRAEAVKEVYDYAAAFGKAQVSDYQMTGWKRDARRGGDPVKDILARAREKYEQEAYDQMKVNLADAVLRGDGAAADDWMWAMYDMGKRKAAIKSGIGSAVKRAYQDAWDSGDVETMARIENALLDLAVGFTEGGFAKWTKKEEE